MSAYSSNIKPERIIPSLKKFILAEGLPFTVDLEKSRGCYIYDSLNKRNLLDFFSYFATNALGHNHPKMLSDEKFLHNLLSASIENPSNSDCYTTQYAEFLSTFARVAMPREFKHAFFISGGALAVENALKVAMDWKVRKNFKKGHRKEKGHKVIHFNEAFHGRSGYTLSMTNSKAVQTDYFAKFDWPRIDNPKISFPPAKNSIRKVAEDETAALKQIRKAIKDNKDEICAIIIEPIQSEGGDNHFRKEFFAGLRKIANDHEILLIFDEVQTGVGFTGKFWAYQHYGVTPDILVFGKKMQICGIIATGRVDEVKKNCFTVKGRINSTWGGNLADMVRSAKILRIIEEDRLVDNAARQGKYLLGKLSELSRNRKITNVRGLGLQCAFDLVTEKQRDKLREISMKNNLLLLGAGKKSIRFRPSLIVEKSHIDEAMNILDKSLQEMKL